MSKLFKIVGAEEAVVKLAIAKAVSVLSSGGVVAVPTETIYGVAASVNCSEGIEKIYTIKGRQRSKPIAICISEVDQIDKWANRTVSLELLRDLLPGPVTVVFERTELLNPQLNPGSNLVGVRVPDYPFIRQLVAQCGYPLALTSANVSEAQSTLAVEEFQDLWPQLDLVIDGGRIVESETPTSRRGSTVVNLSKPGKFGVIREGSSYQETVHVLKEKYRLTEIAM